jgi:hypothetical protein
VRVRQSRAFPISLLGLPVPVTAKVTILARGIASGFVSVFGASLAPEFGQDQIADIEEDLSPDSIFDVTQEGIAFPDCPAAQAPQCGLSNVTIDPVFSFDQERFDALAAQRGVASVPLDQYFTFEASPQLYLLPPIPSDISSPGGGGNEVAEPPALALLLVSMGLLGATRWRAGRRRLDPG